MRSPLSARITRDSPEEFRELFHGKASTRLKRLLNIEKTSGDRGIVSMRYPAFGDWAVYRIRHPSGYARFDVKDLSAVIDSDTTIRRRIELAPYATLQGNYLPKVAENEFLEVYLLKPTRLSIDAPSVRVTLDASGRFDLGPRLAGWHSFVHRIEYSDTEGRGSSSAMAIYGPFSQTVDLALGNAGRPVIGRLLLPDGSAPEHRVFEISVNSGKFPGHPRAPSDIKDDEALVAWWDAYWESDKGRLYRHYKRRSGMTATGTDGSFRLPMLKPGKYTLNLAGQPRHGLRLTLAKMEFEIPVAYSAEPLDLGDLKLSADK